MSVEGIGFGREFGNVFQTLCLETEGAISIG